MYKVATDVRIIAYNTSVKAILLTIGLNGTMAQFGSVCGYMDYIANEKIFPLKQANAPLPQGAPFKKLF